MKQTRKNRVLCFLLTACLLLHPTAWGASADKLIAFTFDDGPSAHTAELLDGLEQRGAVATFFMNGSNGAGGIVNHRELLQRMIEDGNQLANHTYAHAALSTLSASGMANEVAGVESLLFEAMGGSYIDMVRTPGGAVNDAISRSISAPVVLWSVDTLDWKTRNADSVYNTILNQAKDGSIVLLHDLYSTSIEGALRAIDTLQAQGYEFVTVAELLRRRGITPENGKTYHSAPNEGITLDAYSAPTVSAQADAASGAMKITFGTSDAGVQLYYTTDGSLPTRKSIPYTEPFTLTQDSVIQAVGIDCYGTRTPVSDAVAVSCVQPVQVVSYKEGRLELSSGTPGAEIYYTTDGSTPTTQSTLYKDEIQTKNDVKAIAVREGNMPSAVTTVTITKHGDVFTDLERDAWYYEDVAEAVHQNLLSGTDAFCFSPHLPMTRAMLCTVLYRMAGSPETADTTSFQDVSPEDWYAKAAAWAEQNEIMAGVAEGRFAPNDKVTRQQMAAIAYRYAVSQGVNTRNDCMLTEFDDYPEVEEYAVNALRWSVSMQFFHDVTETNRLQPAADVSRAECAGILRRVKAVLTKKGKAALPLETADTPMRIITQDGVRVFRAIAVMADAQTK